MPLDPQQIIAAGDAYLSRLTEDEDVRSGLADAESPVEVARHISSVTGIHVTEDDVPAIAAHLNANRAAECEQLATQHPALGSIVFEED